jgi:hypothetical protein
MLLQTLLSLKESNFVQAWDPFNRSKNWLSVNSEASVLFTQLSYSCLVRNCNSPDLGNLGIMISIPLPEPANGSL